MVSESGSAMGTLCVLDSKPNSLTKEQKQTLKALARQVMTQFEMRKKNRQLQEQQARLEQINQDLSRFAYVVAHDIKSPCSSLAMSAAYLKDAYASQLDKQGAQFLDLMETTSLNAVKMVDGILEHTQIVNSASAGKETFTFGSIGEEIRTLIAIPPEFTFTILNADLELHTSRYMLLQVLLNLCNNAIKYNDKEKGEITISASATGSGYSFSVADNGPGIKPADQERIFELFSTLGKTDRFNSKGTGIGLSTVKRLVERLNGSIGITSEIGAGSSFNFTVGK